MAGVASVVIGLGTIATFLLVGHCGAFGGTCPNPTPLLDDPVFGAVLVGMGLVTVPIVLWRRRTLRDRLIGLAVAVPVCLLAGLLAADWAAG